MKRGLSTTREVALTAWDLATTAYHLVEFLEFFLLKKGVLDKEWESFREHVEAQPPPLLGMLSEETKKEFEDLREFVKEWSETYVATFKGFDEPQA